MAILILIATILLPPLGVAAKHGLGKTALLNLVLTLLGYIPGLIHGLYVNSNVPFISARLHMPVTVMPSRDICPT